MLRNLLNGHAERVGLCVEEARLDLAEGSTSCVWKQRSEALFVQRVQVGSDETLVCRGNDASRTWPTRQGCQ